jgi:hypothetical protein
LPSLSRPYTPEREHFADDPAVLRLDDGVSYMLCAEAPLLSAGRPLAPAVAVVARPSRSYFWLESRAHRPASFRRSPMTAIFELSRHRSPCIAG